VWEFEIEKDEEKIICCLLDTVLIKSVHRRRYVLVLQVLKVYQRNSGQSNHFIRWILYKQNKFFFIRYFLMSLLIESNVCYLLWFLKYPWCFLNTSACQGFLWIYFKRINSSQQIVGVNCPTNSFVCWSVWTPFVKTNFARFHAQTNTLTRSKKKKKKTLNDFF